MRPEELFLDNYERDGCETVWCWKKGPYASEEYGSEEEALEALRTGTLEFSSLDDEDVLGARYATVEVNEGLTPPFDYWCVEDVLVTEPHMRGRPLGVLPEFPFPKGTKVLRMSAWEFDVIRAEEGPGVFEALRHAAPQSG